MSHLGLAMYQREATLIQEVLRAQGAQDTHVVQATLMLGTTSLGWHNPFTCPKRGMLLSKPCIMH